MMPIAATQAFPRETREQIAERFRAYFLRKKRSGLSVRDARMMIDNVAGPAPVPRQATAQDYTRPRVMGGGARRPTDAEVEAMIGRHQQDEPDEWDAVFDEVVRRCQRNRDEERLILIQYRDNHSWHVTCDELGVGTNAYYRMRNGILDHAGVIAVKLGLLDPWKY